MLAGILGMGKGSAKTDRQNTLAGYGGLRDIFNFATPTGKAEFGAGQEDLGKASDYWTKLLSGDRATMEQAVAPETNAVLSQADAAKREQASMGTSRGGGTAGANQRIQDESMAKVDNLLFGARPAAAKAEESIGGTELSAAMRALGLSETAASDLTALSSKSRQTSIDLHKAQLDEFAKMMEMAAAGAAG